MNGTGASVEVTNCNSITHDGTESDTETVTSSLQTANLHQVF